jgi:hypothetical protein
MFNNCKNLKKQGDCGLAIAISWFVLNGYTVSIPLTDSQDYDLIVEKEAKVFRVQVKTTKCMVSGHYLMNLVVRGGNRSGTGVSKKLVNSKNIDLFFCVTEIGTKYLVPRKKIKSKHVLTLNEKCNKFKVN